eukprot:TRINITY_DN30099_c0_g1_i3.p2 TRINITY_DN30099_c0_g1~~TRINITY_DN30099_c0_g1_i3.p2  ORF type:complete len:112 (-),score=10.87 TRINITY_DN30099_c0_g1_i3:9-344(-)
MARAEMQVKSAAMGTHPHREHKHGTEDGVLTGCASAPWARTYVLGLSPNTMLDTVGTENVRHDRCTAKASSTRKGAQSLRAPAPGLRAQRRAEIMSASDEQTCGQLLGTLR